MNTNYYDRLQEYVRYQFRFSKGEEDRIKEIISNMSERFDSYIAKGMSEEEAYKETVKTFGDLQVDGIEFIQKQETLKSDWGDGFLIAALVTAISGAVVLFLVAWLGILLTVVSLCLYGSAASHFYSLALEKKSEGDIPAHKLYLQKIFKFIKTDFVFYSISFTFIATIVSVNLLLSLMTGGFLFGGNLTVSPDSLNINFTFLIVIGILVFIAAAVTCIILSVKLYKKLMNKYYNLTGETYIKSAYKEAKESLYRK